MIVTSCLESKPISLEAITFSLIFPFKEPTFANNPSTESYSAINFWAVFFPTPDIPGILSAASPIIAKKSITWLTFFILNLSRTSLIPHVSVGCHLFPGLYIKIFSETN